MNTETNQLPVANVGHKAATPVAGASAGMLFAVLFSASIIIITTTMARMESGAIPSLEGSLSSLELALGLIPFEGLFFLWFIAVARQHLGRFEDQFFATIFLGSGIIFLSLTLAAAALAGASLANAQQNPAFAGTGTYDFARLTVAELLTVFVPKMTAVFVLSQAVLWLTTKVMPRWMAVVALLVALILMFGIAQSPWIVLIFPAWVGLVSAYILVTHFRSPGSTQQLAPKRSGEERPVRQ